MVTGGITGGALGRGFNKRLNEKLAPCFLCRRYFIASQYVSGAAKVCYVKTNVRVREKNTFL